MGRLRNRACTPLAPSFWDRRQTEAESEMWQLMSAKNAVNLPESQDTTEAEVYMHTSWTSAQLHTPGYNDVSIKMFQNDFTRYLRQKSHARLQQHRHVPLLGLLLTSSCWLLIADRAPKLKGIYGVWELKFVGSILVPVGMLKRIVKPLKTQNALTVE